MLRRYFVAFLEIVLEALPHFVPQLNSQDIGAKYLHRLSIIVLEIYDGDDDDMSDDAV